MDRDAIRLAIAQALAEHELSLQEITWKEHFVKKTLTISPKVTGLLIGKIDRDAIRLELSAALEEHQFNLDEITWKENFKKDTVTLGLKVSGLLLIQESLPLMAGAQG